MAKRADISTKAVAYLRTSSAANVGADRDSDKRQRETIGSDPPYAHASPQYSVLDYGPHIGSAVGRNSPLHDKDELGRPTMLLPWWILENVDVARHDSA